MTVLDVRPITNAVLEMLRTSAGVNAPIGDHEAPTVEDEKPWGIVFLIDGGRFSGPPLQYPDVDADLVYQVDSVGRRRDQAEWLADLVRRTFLARVGNGFQAAFPAVSGWKVSDRRPAGGAGGVQPEGSPPNRIYTVAERFILSVTPT